MSLFHLLFGFSGRANRGKFWLAVVLWMIFWAIAVPVCVLAAIIILGLHLPDSSLPHDELIARYVRLAFDYLGLLIVFIAFTVVSWISAFAVGVKRLHDRDKSGWWIVLLYLAPSVLGSIANTSRAAPCRFCPWGRLFRHLDLGRWSSSVSCAGASVPSGYGSESAASARRCRRFYYASICRSLISSGVGSFARRLGRCGQGGVVERFCARSTAHRKIAQARGCMLY